MMLVENVFSLPLIGHLHLLSTKQSDKLHSGLKVKPQNHGKTGFCVVADFKVIIRFQSSESDDTSSQVKSSPQSTGPQVFLKCLLKLENLDACDHFKS